MSETENNQQKEKKQAPAFDLPRSERARLLVTGAGEDPSAVIPEITKQEYSAANERKQKTFNRFMLSYGVTDVDSIDLKRLNCEIPKQLHTWLNVYARSDSSEYSSMTEIVIDLLGEFAKQRGFKLRDDH